MKIIKNTFFIYGFILFFFVEIPSAINWIINDIVGKTIEYQILIILCIGFSAIIKILLDSQKQL